MGVARGLGELAALRGAFPTFLDARIEERRLIGRSVLPECSQHSEAGWCVPCIRLTPASSLVLFSSARLTMGDSMLSLKQRKILP